MEALVLKNFSIDISELEDLEKYTELCRKAIWIEEDTIRKKAQFIEEIFKSKVIPIVNSIFKKLV